VFDSELNPAAPGARDLAETIVAKLRNRVSVVTQVEQHEFYGWAFETAVGKGAFYNVLNP